MIAMVSDTSERTGAGTTDEETGESVRLDAFYRALSSQTRRRVLYYLQEHPTVDVAELSDVLVGWQSVDRGGLVGKDVRERVRVSLRHVDLPKLDSAGIVTYDPDDGEVSLSTLPEELSQLLQRAQEYDAHRERPDDAR